jgi:DNA repair protein RadD
MDEKVTWAAINESLSKGPDRNCRLVFCTGVEHAILANDMLKHLGLNSACVHSRMGDDERNAIMSAYFNGDLDTLTNNSIATTGIDHPPIDHIIMLRPTRSVGLWVQMLGRGTRPYELNGWHKQDCLVTDHGGNAARLGTIDDPYIPKQRGKGTGDMPVKLCPACGTYNHAAARFCDDCGEPFEQRIGYKETSSDLPLVRSDLPEIKTINVDHVYFTQYLKKGATPLDKPVIKATYVCNLQRFTEFVAIEGTGFAVKRARDWWRQRFPQDGFMPATVNEAMQFVDKLTTPKTIDVWVNKKYPEIMSYGF